MLTQKYACSRPFMASQNRFSVFLQDFVQSKYLCPISSLNFWEGGAAPCMKNSLSKVGFLILFIYKIRPLPCNGESLHVVILKALGLHSQNTLCHYASHESPMGVGAILD